MKLTDVELSQLLAYCNWAYTSGCHYGNKAQFEARHTKIINHIQSLLDKEKTK